MSEGRGIRCDGCESRFMPRAENREKDGLEITTFQCPFCGKEYFVAVTDEELRKQIAEYSILAARNRRGRLKFPEQRRMQDLKAANVERSKQLKRQYLEGKNVEEETKRDRASGN